MEYVGLAIPLADLEFLQKNPDITLLGRFVSWLTNAARWKWVRGGMNQKDIIEMVMAHKCTKKKKKKVSTGHAEKLPPSMSLNQINTQYKFGKVTNISFSDIFGHVFERVIGVQAVAQQYMAAKKHGRSTMFEQEIPVIRYGSGSNALYLQLDHNHHIISILFIHVMEHYNFQLSAISDAMAAFSSFWRMLCLIPIHVTVYRSKTNGTACGGLGAGACAGKAECVWCGSRQTCMARELGATCEECSLFDMSSEECARRSGCSWCPSQAACQPASKSGGCVACAALDSGHCDQSSFCSWCPASRRCQGLSDTCARCESQGDAAQCGRLAGCGWCAAGGACTEAGANCTACAGLRQRDVCGSDTACAWCETRGLCVGRQGGQCPACSALARGACTAGACQWCAASLSCVDASNATQCECGARNSSCGGSAGCRSCATLHTCVASTAACPSCLSFTVRTAPSPPCHLPHALAM
eukprot:m51a1_g11632 hypothetical protein (470) ;mRNA; f:13425-39614